MMANRKNDQNQGTRGGNQQSQGGNQQSQSGNQQSQGGNQQSQRGNQQSMSKTGSRDSMSQGPQCDADGNMIDTGYQQSARGSGRGSALDRDLEEDRE